MSWFGSILGQREVSASADILLERLQDSVKIEDRRKTIADLKSIVNDNHMSIGKSIKVLVNVLKADRQDIDIIRDIIEILIAIMICSQGRDNTVELNNTDDFIKDANNVAIVLGLLEEKDYYIRYYTTQLVTTLLSNKSDDLQNAILQSPMGISRLMDLLVDPREIVRNEALLLLLELTKSNQEIQKIVAFEGAFERLLDIIRDEGSAEGGIIVHDCLRLINNLLRNNVSNQNYFRETNCVKRLTPLLEVQNSDMWILTDNKFNIILLALNLISLLISGNNPSTYSNQTVLAQNGIINLIVRLALGKMSAVALRSKALYTLGDLIRGHNDNLNAFAGMSLLNEATKSTQPSLLKLVLVLLNAKDIAERLACLHTLQCYLFGNEEGQLALASTITPGGEEAGVMPTPAGQDAIQAASASPISIGGHLLRALLAWQNTSNSSPDPLPSWFAACVLASILKDNGASRELVLRIPLEIPKQGVPLVTLMTKTTRALTQAERSGADILIKVGLLRLLCVWLDQSPASVKTFLSASTNLPFLVELVLQPSANSPGAVHVQGLAALLIGLCFQFHEDDTSSEFSRNALQGIIMHRVGSDKYIEKLDSLRKSEDFTFAEQGKAADPENPSIRFYDYDFTIFYKDAYDKILRHIKGPYKGNNNVNKKPRPIQTTTPSSSAPTDQSASQPTTQPPITHTPQQHSQHAPPHSHSSEHHTTASSGAAHAHAHPHTGQDPVITSYKELIRNQDRELELIKKECDTLKATVVARDSELTSLHTEVSSLKTALSTAATHAHSVAQPTVVASIDPAQMEAMAALSQAYNELEELMHHKDDEINELKKQIKILHTSPLSPAPTLRLSDDEDIFSRLQEQNAAQLSANYEAVVKERDELLRKIGALQTYPSQMEHLQVQIGHLNAQAGQLRVQNTQLQAQLQLHAQEKGKQSPVGDGRDLRVAKLEMLLRDEATRYAALEKEQEELLQVLANTEIANNNLKERLRRFEPVA